MKKVVRKLSALIMIAIMLFAVAVPVTAETEFEFENDPNCIWELFRTVGDEYTGFKDRVAEGYEIYSSDEEIMFVEDDGTLIAKREGTAYIAEVLDGEVGYYYGFHISSKPSYIDSNRENFIIDFQENIKEKTEDALTFAEIFVPVMIALAILLLLTEITYIFVTAPKFGMSRLWALAPVIGNVFGLVVFLVLKTMAKQNGMAQVNVITCPVCNAKHPYGTEVCSICGAKLAQ